MGKRQYTDGDAQKYFSLLIASLVFIATAVSIFIYSFVAPDPDSVLEFEIEEVDGFTNVNPGSGLRTPDSTPYVPPPTSPPPAN